MRIYLFILGLTTSTALAEMVDTGADLNALPKVPEEFTITEFAREPLVRQPCSMAFDTRGRLFVGMGPQYRNPTPDTPGDSVAIVSDENHDGTAEKNHTFATGLNAIQGLAWHGRDLWIANSPDLTVVRDLDGDDIADEYVKVYTDLGNIEHALHGLVWAPDGKLYMSKGNSKGINDPKQPHRVAPQPFRELFGQSSPPGTPVFPAPHTYKAAEYKHTYQDPKDDWGLMGGILRCDDGGENLEIVSRGFRNPWDIAMDDGFNWLCTDNDQNDGDRIMMPFYGAHFGWNHPWSSSWTGEGHLPTAPVSHPVFHGSGTGIVYEDQPHFPKHLRGVFFINDWLRKTTLVYKPKWDGALMKCEGDEWKPFIIGGNSLFRPTDITLGPDGAVWCLSWSRGYGAELKDGKMTSEGRIYRIAVKGAEVPALSAKPMADRSVGELVDAFNSPLPVHRIDAQDELVRRGKDIQDKLGLHLERGKLTQAQQTWGIWTLGRIVPITIIDDGVLTEDNENIQTLRSSMRNPKSITVPAVFRAAARQDSARMRFEVVQAIWQTRNAAMVPLLEEIADRQTDRLTFYSAWRALRDLASTDHLKKLLRDPRDGVRRAAVLALLEDSALGHHEVKLICEDKDKQTATLAAEWIKNTSGDGQPILVKGGGVNSGNVAAITGTPPEIKPQIKLATVDEALAAIPSADAKRGRLLALHPAGAGCIACHNIGGRGNHFGPDLTGIGSRAELKHLVQSMVEPSAVITEGFNTQVITTAQGVQTGVLLEESGLAITLGLPTGQRARIMRADITKQETLPISAMPPFNTLLSAQQCADICAWLMTQKDGLVSAKVKKEKKATDKDPKVAQQITPAGPLVISPEPLSFRQEPDRLIILHGAEKIGEFVFAGSVVKRPFFSNLRAPGGIQVTRTFPPIEGMDATDHADMHPGIWIGFGDINGEDFWRNKGTIRHDKFIKPPVLEDEDDMEGKAIKFATLSTLLTKDGNRLAQLDSELTIGMAAPVAGASGGALIVLWNATFRATEGHLVFGDQEEMGFGVRVATAITEKNGGVITNSNKLTGAKNAWGQPAEWCDYSGMIDGHSVGITIVPKPRSSQPTWWHTRDYGVFVANAFGRKAMKRGEKMGTTVKKGGTLELGYAAILHSGDYALTKRGSAK
jgi:putative membrane-bound dehydrogenase-like protein